MKLFKSALYGAVVVSVILVAAVASNAQDNYPSKPIDMIIGYSPGGGTDLIGRALSSVGNQYLGQPLVCVSKPGAGGSIGATYVARSKPDGYTIYFGYGSGETVVGPHIRKLKYDPFKDFRAVCVISNYPLCLIVQADSPWKTLEDFVNDAKANPDKIQYGIAGAAGINGLTMLLFQKESKIKLTGVTFNGVGPAVTALLGGHVQATSCPIFVALPHVKAGKLRILAITSKTRDKKNWPDLATFTEYGYDVRAMMQKGIAVPAATPDSIVDTLAKAFEECSKDKSFVKLMAKMGTPINYMGPQEALVYLKDQYEICGGILKEMMKKKK